MYYVELLISGLASGATYALFAVGLTMVYGTFRFINFAHGELIAWGAYGLLLFMLPPLSLSFAAALAPALALSAIIALGTERIAFRPLRKKAAVTILIASIGASYVLRSALQLAFGGDLKSYPVAFEGTVDLMGVRVTHVQIAMVAAAAASFAALHWLLRKTRIGKYMRAFANNPDLAAIYGLPLAAVRIAVWVLGAGLAALGGVLVGLDSNLDPFMGLSGLIKAFAAVLIGGPGNVFGALIGGLLIGTAENLSTAVISPGYKDFIAFAIIFLLLLFRPQGLFAGRTGVR